ncbi:MAG: ABC transporter substrate-binding protein [Bacteroidota bacterium]
MTIQLNWFPDGEHSYLYLAQEKGWFSDAGFDVAISAGSGSELSAKLVAARSSDFGLMGPDAMLAVVEQGGRLRSLGVIYDKTPVVIYALTSSGITSFSNLKGKTLGSLIGSNTYVQYKGLVEKGLIDGGAVNEQAVDGRTGPTLLDEGKIDALMYYTQYVDAFEAAAHQSSTAVDIKKYHQIPFSKELNMYGMVLTTNDGVMTALGEKKVRKFVSVVQRAIREANANKDSAIDALAKKVEIKNKDRRVELAKLESVLAMACHGEPGCARALEQSEDGWRETSRTVKGLKIISDESIWEKVFPSLNGLR